MQVIHHLRAMQQAIARNLQYSLLLALLMIASAFTTKSVLAATWTAERAIPGVGETIFPFATIDSTGMVHVLFLEFVDKGYPVLYARGQMNATGTAIAWEGIQRLGVSSKRDFLPILVDSAGVVHAMFIGTNGMLNYLSNASRGVAGGWSVTAIAPCSWSPGLTLGSDGYLYATCSRNDSAGTQILLFYRTPQGAWGGPVYVSNKQRNFRANRIAYAGGFVHILSELQSEKDGPFVTHYFRGGLGGFSSYNFTKSLGKSSGDNGLISADPQTGRLYAGFRHGNLDGYYFAFTTSLDGGASWSPATDLLKGYRWWYAATSLYTFNNIASIASEQQRWDGSGIADIFVSYEEFNPARGFSGIQQLTGSKSTQPTTTSGAWGKVVAWIRGYTNGVYYATSPGDGPPAPIPPTNTPTPTVTPTPERPAAFFQIAEGDAGKPVKGADTTLLITMSRGSANRYKVWNEGSTEPAYQELNPPLTAPPGNSVKVLSWRLGNIGSNNGEAPCVERTVKAKLASATGSESEVMSAVARVDPGVDATVAVRNPGPGDPGYTKTPAFVLDVQANRGECSGIGRVRVGQYAPGQSVTNTLRDDDFVDLTTDGPIPLISDIAGTYRIDVLVEDMLGWSYTYQRQITLDKTKPTIQVASGGGMSIQNSQTDQDITETKTTRVDLSFRGIQVNEETYQNGGRNFWGVCVVNSLQTLPLTSTGTLNNCSAVEVNNVQSLSSNTYTFRVEEWELTRGLSTSPLPPAGSKIHVYACVMDGANCSDQVMHSEVVLSQNYVVGTKRVYLPLINRGAIVPSYYYPR